jgi:hypothetical protein
MMYVNNNPVNGVSGPDIFSAILVDENSIDFGMHASTKWSWS